MSVCVARGVSAFEMASNPCSSLLFSLEVEAESTSRGQDAGAFVRMANLTTLSRFQAAEDPEAMQLVFDVRRLMSALRAESADGTVDVKELAAQLSAMGYRVTVRNALGGGPACFRNLRHEFLTVQGVTAAAAGVPTQQQQQPQQQQADDPSQDVTFIVDPSFRQQFEVSQPSSAYAAALELVPPEFVGTSSRLVPLVHCLCAEMAASFEVMGLTLPPWRRAGAMLSKWQPSRCRDVCIVTNSDSSAAAAASPSASGNNGEGGCICGSGGSSPQGNVVAGSSPFSRIEDHEIARQCSVRSLLSGKLTAANSAASSSVRSSLGVGSNLGRAVSGCSGLSPASSTGNSGPLNMQAQLVLAQQQQARAQAAGTVSRQPPVYRGQPATYTVKMGSVAPQQQQ